MADNLTKLQRAKNMRLIRSKNTIPEIVVRKFLFQNGFRYRLHSKNLPGRPDIVLKKFNTVIFINGCFWHGHLNCKNYILPKTNTTYWKDKIKNNIKRDKRSYKSLISQGWKIEKIWECELRKDKTSRLNRLINNILKNQTS